MNDRHRLVKTKTKKRLIVNEVLTKCKMESQTYIECNFKKRTTTKKRRRNGKTII